MTALRPPAGRLPAPAPRPLRARAPERRRHPDLQGTGLRGRAGNWRGLLARKSATPEERAALDPGMSELVQSGAWKALLKERGRVDRHMSSAEFAAFLEAEKVRIGAILADLGFGD